MQPPLLVLLHQRLTLAGHDRTQALEHQLARAVEKANLHGAAVVHIDLSVEALEQRVKGMPGDKGILGVRKENKKKILLLFQEVLAEAIALNYNVDEPEVFSALFGIAGLLHSQIEFPMPVLGATAEAMKLGGKH